MDKTGTKKRNTTRNRVDERVKEEEDTQGTVERKKTEGVGTSQGIQGHGRSQEKDDGDGLPDESPVKRKVRLKKKKTKDQGVCASKTRQMSTETFIKQPHVWWSSHF